MTAENAIVNRVLNFRVSMLLKGTINNAKHCIIIIGPQELFYKGQLQSKVSIILLPNNNKLTRISSLFVLSVHDLNLLKPLCSGILFQKSEQMTQLTTALQNGGLVPAISSSFHYWQLAPRWRLSPAISPHTKGRTGT